MLSEAGGGIKAISAVADWEGSSLLIAVTDALVLTVAEAARKRPVLEIVPPEADQVTPAFKLFATVAANCKVPPAITLADAGVTVTTGLPPFAIIK